MKFCPVCEKTYGDDLAVCTLDGTPLRMRAPSEDRLIGQVIKGRYRVLRKLGAGGMGAVYLGEQLSVDRKVALKVLQAEFARDEDFVRRFRQEARLAASLNHRNVVTVYEFDQAEDGSLFLAMEFVEGKSLSEVIREQGPLEVDRAVRLGLQIAEGLGAAHRAGVIHRDVKPQNIMVVGSDEIKLMDFGIARLRDTAGPALTRSGVIMGTPHYMAPEQIEGGEITERTDIYAFGVVLYEMLTGTVPFGGATAGVVLAKHLNESPVSPRNLWPEIPPAVERVALQALEKDPNARQRDMREVAAGLRGGGDQAEERPIMATRPMGREGTQFRQTAPRLEKPEVPQTMAVAATMASEAPRPTSSGRWKLFAAVGGIAVVLAAFVGGVFYYVGGSVRGPAVSTPAVPAPGTSAPVVPPAAPVTSPPPAPAAPGTPPQPAPPAAGPPVPPPLEPAAGPPGVASPSKEREDPFPRPGGLSKGRPRPPVTVDPAIASLPPSKAPPAGGGGAGASAPTALRGLVEQKLRGRGLLKQSAADQLGVTVEATSDGIITLTGVVRDSNQRGETIRLAKEVPGVTEVRPKINVRGSWDASD